jgi:hypothetical protein
LPVAAALNDMMRQPRLVAARAARHARQFKSSATQNGYADPEEPLSREHIRFVRHKFMRRASG